MNTIRTVLDSKTRWWHFFALLIGTVLVTIFILVIPIVLWSFYGDAASSDWKYDQPIVIFVYEWFALIAAMTFLISAGLYNLKKGHLSNAKSYLIIIPLVTILYLLRYPIMDFVYEIF